MILCKICNLSGEILDLRRKSHDFRKKLLIVWRKIQKTLHTAFFPDWVLITFWQNVIKTQPGKMYGGIFPDWVAMIISSKPYLEKYLCFSAKSISYNYFSWLFWRNSKRKSLMFAGNCRISREDICFWRKLLNLRKSEKFISNLQVSKKNAEEVYKWFFKIGFWWVVGQNPIWKNTLLVFVQIGF